MTQQPKSSSPNVAHILNARVRFGKDDIRTVDVSIANGRIAAIADAGELQTTVEDYHAGAYDHFGYQSRCLVQRSEKAGP